MIDLPAKQKIMSDFCEFIENLPQDSEIELDPVKTVDLFTLYNSP